MSHSLENLLLGRILLDRYEVQEVIGRGGMSIVYRATDRRLGRAVALKIVSLPAHDAEERAALRERFRREAAAAASIPTHASVVQVYDYGTDPELDLDFIVMELLRGRDLKAAIAGRELDDAEALRVMREAARGVAAGHRAGIVHRDVKPANIFLAGTERVEQVKILDFGIAKAMEGVAEDDLTRAGQLPHSPAWASPEQRRSGEPLTPASDVYQLGLVAYELFTGARPFQEEERERLSAGEGLPLPERGDWHSLAPPLREIIARALASRPEDRYPDAATFAEALAAVPERWRRDEDATLLVPDDDHTVIAPVGAGGNANERGGAGAARRGGGGPQPRYLKPARRLPAWAHTQLLRFGVGIVLVALGLWALGVFERGDGAERTAGVDPDAEAGALDVSAIEEEFQELYHRAVRNLGGAGDEMDGQAAADAVSRVIADAQEAFVLGELDRHLSHYASRVDFYTAGRVPRSRVERERRADIERFPNREMSLNRQAIEMTGPGEARALVDRSWHFTGPVERWTGSGRQELRLERSNDRWRIVSEKDVEVYRSARERV
jgi:predicted Ser/Thr protein kinase